MTGHFGLFCTMLFASACYAQSWVSTNGNDTGTCTRSAPCRTFNTRLSKPPLEAKLTLATRVTLVRL